jgi:hypothetical protein
MSRRLAGLAAVLLLASARAQALDATLFLSGASPAENWKTGYGGAITTTWFHVLALEGEAARQPLDTADGTLVSFTGSALLAPSFARLTPYGGLGVGLFRQTLGTQSDSGTLRCFVLGLKLKLGLVVLKGDYRNYSLSGTPLVGLHERITLGGGISF